MTDRYLEWDAARPVAGYQGISYLELELLPTSTAPTEVRLTVHLQRAPVGIDQRSFAIGGRGLSESIEWTLEQVTGGADPRAVLRFGWIEEQMRLFLVLLRDGTAPVHPFFSIGNFLLDIDCPKGDCRPGRETADRPLRQRPAIDLLTKDYDGFVQLLSDRLRVTNPSWADLAPASLERALVELLSHFGDLTSYFQDRVANEAFIDDAVQRHSLRQHGILLGYELFDGTAAETTVAFTTTNDGFLPKGTSLRMLAVADEAPIVFYLPHRVRLLRAHNELPMAAWPGAEDAAVPAGADTILLFGHIADLEGRRVAFRQGDFVQVVTVDRARSARLPGWVQDPSDPETTDLVDVTELRFSPPLRRQVRPFETVGEGRTFSVLGNLGIAAHGEQRLALLNVNATPGSPAADIALDRRNSTIVRVGRGTRSVDLLRALRVPEGPVVFRAAEDGRVGPILELEVDGEMWERREHLHNSKSFDPHYVTTTEEDGTIWLQFGDGRHGAAVEVVTGIAPRPQLKITYRVGSPSAGNCAPGTLTEVIIPGNQADADQVAALGLQKLENILPGTGGRLQETRAAARQAIPASLRHGPPQRAVSLGDYAVAARKLDEVSRATARSLGGVFNTVQVLVDPEGQAELTEERRRAVEAHLDRLRMTGREVVVDRPTYVPLDVELAVCPQPGIPSHRVRDAVHRALLPGTRSRRGFFHPDNLSFAEAVELGDVLAEVQRVPGVRSVKALTFRKLAVVGSGPVETRIAVRGLEVARLDADDSQPENGRLVVRLVGVDEVETSVFSITEASGGPS